MIYQWRKVLDEFHQENGGEPRIMMTEAYANQSFVMKYYKNVDGTRPGSHVPFNFLLITDLHSNSTAADFKRVIDSQINALPPGKQSNWVMGNHDRPRVASRYGSEKVDSLLALVMCLPGIAVTYYVSCFYVVLLTVTVTFCFIKIWFNRVKKLAWLTFVMEFLLKTPLILLPVMPIQMDPEMVGNWHHEIRSEHHYNGMTVILLDFVNAQTDHGYQFIIIINN